MMRVATSLLTPEEMGRVSMILTSTAFFAMFLVNPVGMFINRRLHAWQDNGVAKYYLIRYVNYLLFVAILSAIIVYFVDLLDLVNFGVSIDWLISLIAGSLLFNTINQTAIPSLNLLGFSRLFVFLSVASIAASFACAVLFIFQLETSAQYWLLGLLAGQTLLAVVGSMIFFSRLKKSRPDQVKPYIGYRHLSRLISFAWPVSIAAGLAWIQGQGYRYLLEYQLGLAQLGLFVAGYGISAGMIAGFESVLTTYFQPRLYRDVNINDPVKQAMAWQRYASAVIPSLIITVMFISVLAPELTRLFLGDSFQLAAEFVIWGALTEAARVLMGVYSLIAHVYMRTVWLILPNLIGAVLAIILTMHLLPYFGSAGAGMALVLSGFLVVLVMHFKLLRQLKGGRLMMRPILLAAVASMVLWGMALGLRYILQHMEWLEFVRVIGMIATMGISYLGIQYLFLRQHLMEKFEA